MANIMSSILDAKFSRRDFLKGTMAATAAIAGLGLLPKENALAESTAPVEHPPIADQEEGGKWVSAACWHNCGGRCINLALVKDGVVLRQKTDDSHPDSPDFPQQRACQRGRSQRMQVFGADRLKYPMKRKNWSLENPNGELRGEDEWERISWDEAYTIIAETTKKLYDQYGPETCFVAGGSYFPRVLQGLGGYTPRWGQVSWGAWPDVYQTVTGVNGGYLWNGPDRFTLRKQKLMIFWGCNPAVSSAGLPHYNYIQARKAGTEFVVIDPRYTETAPTLDATWIPMRPGTDTAMVLGMIQHIIASGLHDKDYLDKYCVGFDSEHMPSAGGEDFTYGPLERVPFVFKPREIDPADNFYDYVMGEGKWADEGAKTPEWASEICGVPAETIKELAVKYATTKPACIYTGGAPARHHDGECFPHALLALGMVCGQIGRDGAAVVSLMEHYGSFGGPDLVSQGGAGDTNNMPANPFPQKTHALNNGEMWTAILEGKRTDHKDLETGEVVMYPLDIHMIHQSYGGALNQRQGMTQGLRAYKKVDFVTCINYVFNTSAKYADIVLPCTTEWERPGALKNNRELLSVGRKIAEPLFEAKSDREIAMGVADKLHELYPEEYPYTGADISGVNEWQQFLNKLAGCKYTDTDGEKKPLLTITQEDVDRYIAESGEELAIEPQEGIMDLAEFEARGGFQIPNPEEYLNLPFKAFIDDPDANPLNTPSGKFEIHCQLLSDYIEWLGFSSKDPLPKYVRITEGYEDGLENDMPFQFINHHYQRRSHHVFDNLTWLREAFPQELWINADDAAKLDIKTGDIVLVESSRGKIARPAYVTERIAPGVISVGEGAWAQLNKDGVDVAGAANTLTSWLPTGQGHSGYNSNNTRISKYEDQSLLPDAEWEKRIIFPEA